MDLVQATSPYELESTEVVQISSVYAVLLRTRSALCGRHDTASPGNTGAFLTIRLCAGEGLNVTCRTFGASLFVSAGYSHLRATMGSTRDARRAGR